MTTHTTRYPINGPLNKNQARAIAQTTGVQFDSETVLDIQVSGIVTEEQFHAIFGPEADIKPMLAKEADAPYSTTVIINMEDVLCEHNSDGMQARLITYLAEKQDLDASLLAQEFFKNIDELSPDVALKLLNMAAEWAGEYIDQMTTQTMEAMIRDNGITLNDLAKPEELDEQQNRKQGTSE